MLLNSRRIAAAVCVLPLAVLGCADFPSGTDASDGVTPQFAKQPDKGNGAPSGSHYTLLIHGVEDKGQTVPSFNGQNMWVKLWGKTNILLTEGDFGVIDPDGLDGEASYRLPNPDADGDGVTTYSVFARGLGKGSAKVTLCAYDSEGDLICNTGELIVTLQKGEKNRFSNVSKELLFLWDVDLDGDGTVDINRVGLFDEALQGYFWEYDNWGLRLAQLRFYPCSTDVGDTSSDPINDEACFEHA